MKKLSKNRNKESIFLLLIFLAALFLRLYRVTEVPVSLNWDEAAIGYNAYSILKTGRDEWGKLLPLTFRSFGDYKAPLLIYLTVPFIAVFGLNELAVRLPIVMVGALTPIATYFLLKNLFPKKSRNIWVIGTVLMTISPWHILFTRAAFEASLSLFLFLWGLIFWLRFFIKKDNSLYWSVFFFILSMYAYHSTKILVPLFFIWLIYNYRHLVSAHFKKITIPFLILMVFVGQLIVSNLFLSSSSRAQGTLIFFDQYVKEKNQYLFEIQKQALSSAQKNKDFKLVFWNQKPVFILRQFVNNFSKHLNPQFLLGTKPVVNQRVSISGFSYFNWIELLLSLVGLFALWRYQPKQGLVLTGLILLSIVPPALSMESPHPLRGIFYFYVLVMLIAIGVSKILWLFCSTRKLFFIVVILIMGGWGTRLASFYRIYFSKYPLSSAYDWQYGMKQAVSLVLTNLNNQDAVYFSNTYGQAYIHYLFYSRHLLVKEGIKDHQSTIGKIIFVEDPFPTALEMANQSLVVAYKEDPLEGEEIMKKIFYPDGQLAFVIYENK